MVSTCFLSMWMSNTATTAMMVPLALTVMDELSVTTGAKKSVDSHTLEDAAHETVAVETLSRAATATLRKKSEHVVKFEFVQAPGGKQNTKQMERVRKGLLLSICYAANIGGTGTLTGSTTNLVLMGQLHSLYKCKETGLNYASWMAFSLPQMILILFIAWLWLQIIFIGFSGCTKTQSADELAISAVLRKKYNELKPMSFAETVTLFLFILLISLWLFRDPGFIDGWGSLFPAGYVSDGTAAMIVSVLLFVIPKELPKLTSSSGNTAAQKPSTSSTLLTWENMQKEFPWGIILLLGGGYAMAAGVKNSGLDVWMSNGFAKLNAVPTFLFVVICVIMVTFLTEFSSNVAIASIFIPIGASVAEQMHINPLYVVLPIAIAAAFAFMLPVATPPNAIVFGTGLLRLSDMASAGFVMNILCMMILLINMNTYGCWLFQCQVYPQWAERETNVTLVIAPQDPNDTLFF